MITVNCDQCGKQIQKHASAIKRTKHNYCSITCQNKHQNPEKNAKRKLETKEIESECEKCHTKFYQIIKIGSTRKYSVKRFCSYKCANSRVVSDKTKQRISLSLLSKNLHGHIRGFDIKKCIRLIKQNIRHIKHCERCGIIFETVPSDKKRFCSHECANKSVCVDAGRKSASMRVKRSKNEMYLYDLCKAEFGNVLSNERMFNGWDADVILPDLKLAIMWNGKWHYKKITEKHSVAQVQNRDKIKIHEIEKAGYTPYVIKDMGKFKKKFVEEEFEKLKTYIAGSTGVGSSGGS